MNRLNRIARASPSGGNDYVGLVLAPDPVDGVPAGQGVTNREQMSVYGLPATPLKIAKTIASADAGKLYPYDGSGALPTQTGGAAAGNNLLLLDSGVSVDASLDYVGLLVVMLSGAAVGEVRDITAFNTGTRVATIRTPANLATGWVTGKVPVATDKYALLVDTRNCNFLHVQAESSGSVNSLGFQTLLCGWPNTAPATPRLNFAWVGKIATSYLGFQPGATYGQESATTYAAAVESIDVRGFMGAKVRLDSIDGGTFSLWAATT